MRALYAAFFTSAGLRMPYAQEISEQNKALLVFLLDQSYSMEEPLGNSHEAKKDVLTQAVNSWLENLVVRLTGSEGVRDWIDVGVIGYGTDIMGEPVIQSPLGGELVGTSTTSPLPSSRNDCSRWSMRHGYAPKASGHRAARWLRFPHYERFPPATDVGYS